ncbi:efflux RND transporter permease subunit [Chitinophaga sedimenti]|uniref:efflux RND transporter permease subunit n=1 Tax=Chitinophaga sedimenti TaxID=2033606 RepID=UPI0020035E3A|nr:efflux RND transporter permease subunit [Chitinophaga sedimenti]MCK7556206.1 efflux RND transporter permease subunit [Chitinophaga sedimenti]
MASAPAENGGAVYGGHRPVGQYRKSFLVCIILVWGIPLGSLPDHIDGKSAFTRIYNETLGSPYFIRKVRPELDRYLGGMARSFIRSVKANGGLQSEARTRLNVHAVLPQGSTLEQIDVIMQSLENYMQQVTGVERFLTNIYSGEFAMMEISFNRQIENGSFPARLKAALMAKTLDWGGVEWSITGVGQGYNNASAADVPNYLVVMKGYNYRELEQYADRLVDKLLRNKRVEKTNTGENIVDGERSAEEIVLDMDDYQAAIWHTNKQRLVELVHQRGPLSQHQLQALSGGKYYPVMIREAGGMEFSEYDLLYDQMPLDTAAAGRLADMGTLMRRPAAASIHKEDRRFVRKVGFEYRGSKEFGNRFLKNVMEEMKLEMPVGYTIAQEETAWADFFWDDDSKYFLMPLLVVCIFAICAILFESVRKALLIIPIIPAAFIGIFAIFAWGRLPFDQGGYAAFILVGAFAANSAIFIIYDLQTLLRGRSMQRHNLLLIKAITSRTRTILLTGASTACGFLPFLLDGRKEAFWFSFAAGVTGGLIGACIAVWVLLPVLLWKNKIPNPGPS